MADNLVIRGNNWIRDAEIFEPNLCDSDFILLWRLWLLKERITEKRSVLSIQGSTLFGHYELAALATDILCAGLVKAHPWLVGLTRGCKRTHFEENGTTNERIVPGTVMQHFANTTLAEDIATLLSKTGPRRKECRRGAVVASTVGREVSRAKNRQPRHADRIKQSVALIRVQPTTRVEGSKTHLVAVSD